MEKPFGLILQCDFKTIHDFEKCIALIDKAATDWIWLQGNDKIILAHLSQINKVLEQKSVSLICESEPLINEGLNAKALIVADFEKIAKTRKTQSQILLGGLANDLARSKNFELYKADFVILGAIEEIGENPYITIIPQKPDYEWRFIDITIPVIGFGNIANKLLEAFTKKVDLSGFALASSDFQKQDKTKLRFVTS